MLDFDKLNLYKQYLNTIQGCLDSYFENQKEYLCCKKGCAHCCKRGSYPFSQLEFDYLMLGFFQLSKEEQSGIIERINSIKEDYNNCDDKNSFTHRCPFLGEDDICTVYDFRGLICRIFGLLKPDKNGELVMPFCQSLGLNYSKVYNRESKMLDGELVKKYEYKNMPKSYDLSFKTLMDKDLFQDVVIDFGEIKSLIDWL